MCTGRNTTFYFTRSKRRKTTRKEVRNWLDLPRDIMVLIFMKLGPIEIILNAQKVCSSWRKLANEPYLFRTIFVAYEQHHFQLCPNFGGFAKFVMFFKKAVDRSCGQLVKISCEDFLNEGLLEYVVSKPNSLKALRIGMGVSISMNGLIRIFKRLPLLEELDMSHTYYTNDLFEVIGHSCLKLRHLQVDYRSSAVSSSCLECEEQTYAIAKNMTHLHSLHLIGSKITNKVLQAILEGCPNLEYLDLSQCFNFFSEGDLLKKCVSRIRNIRLPKEKARNFLSTAVAGVILSKAS